MITHRRPAALLAAAALGLTFAATTALATPTAPTTAAHPRPRLHHGRVATVATALATKPGSTATDHNIAGRNLHAHQTRADALATASATCDGCSARAVTIQILHVHPGALTADNVATATSSCTDCNAGAVSVQLVLASSTEALTPNNRAFAANAACTGCHTTAEAHQIVIITDSDESVSPGVRQQLDALRDRLEGALTTPPGQRPQALTSTSTTGRIAQLVAGDLHGTIAADTTDVEQH